jgi:hypothetical protein
MCVCVQELGPRDDLWSLLFVLEMFAQGQMPWREAQLEKNKVSDAHKMNRLPPFPLLPSRYMQRLTAPHHTTHAHVCLCCDLSCVRV